MYRSPDAPRKQKKTTKEYSHPDCAIHTRHPRGDGQNDTILYLNLDALTLGKLRTMSVSMLGLHAETTDWSSIHEPLARKLRTVVGTGQCVNILSSAETFSIAFVVRRDVVDEVSKQIKDYFAKFNITAGIFS